MATELVGETRTAEGVAVPVQGRVFFSRVDNLMLTMRANGMSFPMLQDHVGGIQRTLSPGFRVLFADHYLTVTPALQAEWEGFVKRYGKHYVSDDEELAALLEVKVEDALRERGEFGSSSVDGYWALDAPVPPATPELRAIVDALLADDEPLLIRIYEAEIEGYNRPDVRKACEDGLEKLYQLKLRREMVDGPAGAEDAT